MADTTTTVDVKKEGGEHKKYTLWEAIGLNTMMMFGTGPFISIPYCIAGPVPSMSGPGALLGYTIAAIGCMCDSFIWGELGSRFPESGGPYVYLRECFGKETWGKLFSFIYIWQFWISAPAEVASGFIAISSYMAYIYDPAGEADFYVAPLIAEGLLFASVLILCLGNGEIGKFVIVLWVITLGAIAYCIVGGLANAEADHFQLPPKPFGDSSIEGQGPGYALLSIGAACQFGIYDFTGYYDVCMMGGEVVKPKRTIPIACIATCAVVLVIYELTYVSVLAYMPWYDSINGSCVNGACGVTCEDANITDGSCVQGFVSTSEDDGDYIMALFAQKMAGGPIDGRGFGIFFAVIVAITIFGSVFSMLSGLIFLPVAAADGGMFFKIFGHRTKSGRPLVALWSLAFLSAFWCWFELDVVISAMTVMLILVQFMGQAIALCVLRYRISKGTMPEDPEAFKVPCFPLVAFFQLSIFTFMWLTHEWLLIILALGFLVIGTFAFFAWQAFKGEWPFKKAGGAPPVKASDVQMVQETAS